MSFEKASGQPVPTTLTASDLRALYGEPNVTHRGFFNIQHTWHRDGSSLTLIDWGMRRETIEVQHG